MANDTLCSPTEEEFTELKERCQVIIVIINTDLSVCFLYSFCIFCFSIKQRT